MIIHHPQHTQGTSFVCHVVADGLRIVKDLSSKNDHGYLHLPWACIRGHWVRVRWWKLWKQSTKYHSNMHYVIHIIGLHVTSIAKVLTYQYHSSLDYVCTTLSVSDSQKKRLKPSLSTMMPRKGEAAAESQYTRLQRWACVCVCVRVCVWGGGGGMIVELNKYLNFQDIHLKSTIRIRTVKPFRIVASSLERNLTH